MSQYVTDDGKAAKTGTGGSTLAPSANEFVPGRFFVPSNASNSGVSAQQKQQSKAAEDINTAVRSLSGMNLAASEWVPSSNSMHSPHGNQVSQFGESSVYEQGGINSETHAVHGNEINPAAKTVPDITGHELENMVEVQWGADGQTYYVPESMTYVSEDGTLCYMGPTSEEEAAANGEVQLDDGMQWAMRGMVQTAPAPPKRSLQTIGVPEPIRQHFRDLDVEALRQIEPEDPRYKELPMRYHAVFPLDSHAGSHSSFGYPSSIYKVIDQTDSQQYAVRRYDNVRTTSAIINNAVARWRNVRHPGITPLYDIFMEKGAIFFAYMYYPSARTLQQRFIEQRGPMLSESLCWRLLVQLLSAVRLVHGRGVAVRVVEPAHIILTSGTCARFSCAGVIDVLEFETRKSMTELQMDDLVKLGRVVLSLATRAVINNQNANDALLMLKAHYSNDMLRVVSTLLTGKANINQICVMCSDRIHDELDTAMASADALHSHLRAEYENGRLLRLLMKFGFMNERPDHTMAPAWSENGDRYVLKLFRDYLFHQVDTEGLPIIDAGHVLSSLNKLDVGDDEEILLSSRDGKDLLVVTFADVQRCFENSFVELVGHAQMSKTHQPPVATQQIVDTDVHHSNGGGDNYYNSSPPYHQQQHHEQMHHQQSRPEHHQKHLPQYPRHHETHVMNASVKQHDLYSRQGYHPDVRSAFASSRYHHPQPTAMYAGHDQSAMGRGGRGSYNRSGIYQQESLAQYQPHYEHRATTQQPTHFPHSNYGYDVGNRRGHY